MSNEKKGLQDLVVRASVDPAYMASAMAEYAQLEHVDVEHVLTGLGVKDIHREHFLLCLRPSGDRFAEMTRAVSKRFVLDESALLTVLRQPDTLSAFADRRGAIIEAGALMAARARNEPKTGRGAKQTSKRRSSNKPKDRGPQSDNDNDDDAR